MEKREEVGWVVNERAPSSFSGLPNQPVDMGRVAQQSVAPKRTRPARRKKRVVPLGCSAHGPRPPRLRNRPGSSFLSSHRPCLCLSSIAAPLAERRPAAWPCTARGGLVVAESLGAPRPDHKFTTVRLSPALPALTSIELETISELKFKTTAGSIFILHHIGLCIVSEHE